MKKSLLFLFMMLASVCLVINYSCTKDSLLRPPPDEEFVFKNGQILRTNVLKDDEFSKTFLTLLPDIEVEKTPISFVLIKNSAEIDAQVVGAILYSHEDNRLKVNVYGRDNFNDKMFEFQDYNLEIQSISIQSLRAIIYGFEKMHSGQHFVAHMYSRNYQISGLDKYPDELAIKVLANSYKPNNLRPREGGSTTGELALAAAVEGSLLFAPGCEESPCPVGPGARCDIFWVEGFPHYFCSGDGPCMAAESGETLKDEEEINQGAMEDLFLNSNYYNLETNVFPNYAIGVKYLNYYDGLCIYFDEISGAYSIPLLLDLLDVMDDVKQMALFLTQAYSVNSVLISSTRADDLKGVLDSYRALSSNDDYEFIIDDIKNDIDTYEGMTVAQIYAAQ